MVCIHVVKKDVFQKTLTRPVRKYIHLIPVTLSSHIICFSSLRFVGSLETPTTAFQSEVLTLTWSLQHLGSFGILLYFLLSLGSLSRCMIPFQPSFSCRTDGLRFDCKIFLHTEEFMLHGCKVHGLCGCKTNPNPYTPTTVLGSCYQVLTCCLFKKHLHLG